MLQAFRQHVIPSKRMFHISSTSLSTAICEPLRPQSLQSKSKSLAQRKSHPIESEKKPSLTAPKKIQSLSSNKPTPSLTRLCSLAASESHATPKLSRRKLTPMNRPPAIRAVPSIDGGPSQDEKQCQQQDAHASIQFAVWSFAPLLPLRLRRKQLYPPHQPDESSNESQRRQRYQ